VRNRPSSGPRPSDGAVALAGARVDRGFISFEADGKLLVSPVAHGPSLERMGVAVGERTNVGAFSEGQRRYLEFHRERVFLEARVRRS